MQRFRLKPLEYDVIEWTGDNANTIVTNYGDLVSQFEDLGDGNFNIHTTDGAVLPIKLLDWMFRDLGNKLRVIDRVVFYKTHDYVSG